MEGVACKEALCSLGDALPSQDDNGTAGDEDGVRGILELDFSDIIGKSGILREAELWDSACRKECILPSTLWILNSFELEVAETRSTLSPSKFWKGGTPLADFFNSSCELEMPISVLTSAKSFRDMGISSELVLACP
jgi:hypothetical protein